MSTPNDPIYSGATFQGTVGTFEYEELLADGHNVTSVVCPFDFVGHPPTVPQLKRGTVMHYVPAAAGSKAWLPAAAAECNAVLVMDVDVSQNPTPPVQLYLSGRMKANAMVYVAGVDPPAACEALRIVGIYVESVLNRQGGMTRAPGITLPQSLGYTAEQEQMIKDGKDPNDRMLVKPPADGRDPLIDTRPIEHRGPLGEAPASGINVGGIAHQTHQTGHPEHQPHQPHPAGQHLPHATEHLPHGSDPKEHKK